ncbi:hypothetical protein RDI58_026229 [Solanum bulbocastanum]|uniref:Uncharacterized protein n=1 Tax=Solanum bulbocastanum TaxID=147425 RepID=A0AAN8Y346_SOLBU
MQIFSLVSIFLFLSFLILLRKWKNSYSQTTKKLPPGPWKLPFIGSMHHIVGGYPHHVLRDLAKKYGPLMHLQLGEVCVVVVTSSEMAKQVLKTHDLAFASRPKLLVTDIITYDSRDIVFSPYGDYRRQMRKICVMELLNAKNVRSFSSIRHDEVVHLIDSIRSSSSSGEPVNFTEMMIWFASSTICRSAFGQLLKEQDIFIKLIREVLRLADQGFDMADIFPSYRFLHGLGGVKRKILDDMFTGGTETTSTTIWAMAEMMKNTIIFAKAQEEVREAFRDKVKFDKCDVEELKYLKLVVKETLRLHPPIPLSVQRECREETEINGYTIPVKTKVLINVWALGRDPKYWDDPESFKPERFEQCSVDFNGNNFEFLPFGSGRRICPGISFGLANIYLPLAQSLYHFDWKLPTGMEPRDLDLTESDGITASRKNDLYLIATPYQP